MSLSPIFHGCDSLELTAVAGLNFSIAFSVIADLLRVRTEELVVHRSVGVCEMDEQGLWSRSISHPGSQGIEGGFRLTAESSKTVTNTRSFEHAIVVVNLGDLRADGVVITQCATNGNKRVRI